MTVISKIVSPQVKRRRLCASGQQVDVSLIQFKQEFLDALQEVLKYDRSTKLSVAEAVNLYPGIVKEITNIVTAMPPTQVSVERLFSALKFICSDLRSSMKNDLSEARLFLRTNYH